MKNLTTRDKKSSSSCGGAGAAAVADLRQQSNIEAASASESREVLTAYRQAGSAPYRVVGLPQQRTIMIEIC